MLCRVKMTSRCIRPKTAVEPEIISAGSFFKGRTRCCFVTTVCQQLTPLCKICGFPRRKQPGTLALGNRALCITYPTGRHYLNTYLCLSVSSLWTKLANSRMCDWNRNSLPLFEVVPCICYM